MTFLPASTSLFSIFYFFWFVVVGEWLVGVTVYFTPIIGILFLYFTFHSVDGLADITNVYDHAR